MVERVRPSEEPTIMEMPRVRGRPFQKGNPGKPSGSKNKITRLLEELVEGEGQKLAKKMLELALAGNPRCLEYFMDRLMPPRRGRVLEHQLPKIKGVNDIGPVMAAITSQLNTASLPPRRHPTCLVYWSVMRGPCRQVGLLKESKRSRRRSSK
jgi:hypothetical protein